MVAVVDRIVDVYRNEYKKRPVSTLFLTILVAFFIIFIAAGIITGGETISGALYWNKEDMFMDYFSSIYSSDHPYSVHRVIYPPLITVFYAVQAHFIIPFVRIPAGGSLTRELIRSSQMGIMMLMIVTLVTFYVLHVIYSRLVKDADIRKELIFFFTILLSYPFVYAVERGNSILLALVFCFIFIMGYRSENRFVRYTSYIALGCATGIKLYPVILWLLIIRNREYKEAAVCAVAIVSLLFIPFVFTDGNPLMLLEYISSYTGSPDTYGFINFSQLIFGVFRDMLGVSKNIVSIVSYTVIGVFTLLSFIVILFDKKMKFWKVLALLSCNLILGLGVGTPYLIVYMSIPILYFLIAEKKMTKENLFYAVCFAMTIVLLPGIMPGDINPSPILGSVESTFVIIVAIALLYEGLKRLYRNRSDEHSPADAATGQ